MAELDVDQEIPVPFQHYSNPVRISSHEFVVASNNMCQLMKYNILNKEWSPLFNWNKQHRSIYNYDYSEG